MDYIKAITFTLTFSSVVDMKNSFRITWQQLKDKIEQNSSKGETSNLFDYHS